MYLTLVDKGTFCRSKILSLNLEESFKQFFKLDKICCILHK